MHDDSCQPPLLPGQWDSVTPPELSNAQRKENERTVEVGTSEHRAGGLVRGGSVRHAILACTAGRCLKGVVRGAPADVGCEQDLTWSDPRPRNPREKAGAAVGATAMLGVERMVLEDLSAEGAVQQSGKSW
eukprot:65696-Prymnesium_polylepis.2